MSGPNGYCKTTILNIINNLFNKDFFYFFNLPFNEIVIWLNENVEIHISVKNTISKNYEESIRGIKVEIEDEDVDIDIDKGNIDSKDVEFLWIKDEKIISKFVLNKYHIKNALKKIGYYNKEKLNNFDLSSKEVYDYIKTNSGIFYNILSRDQNQNMFFMLIGNVRTKFIQAQRLLSLKTAFSEDISSVQSIVERLDSNLRKYYYTYLQMSQTIDSRFIDNLLSNETIYDENRYQDITNDLSSKIEELKLFNMIDPNLSIRKYDINNNKILTAYIQDLKSKIEPHYDNLGKLRLFSKLLEKKYFANKTITFAPKTGLKIKTNTDVILYPDQLSSGEQNEIIMLYSLIFEVSDNTLLLIDEPDISLHVTCQKEFIDDLEDISRLHNIQVIMATPAPHIINNKWDETFDLYENNLI